MRVFMASAVLTFLSLFVSSVSAEAVFTQEEREWIENHPEIIVGGEMDWAPFDFVNAQGDYVGISSDYLQHISERTGLKFKVVTGFSWSELVAKFKNREFDILPAVYYFKQREEYGIHTLPYFQINEYMFVREGSKVRSFADLKGKVLAIPKGYAVIPQLKQDYPDITILETKNVNESMLAVLNREAEAMLEVYAVAVYNIQKEAITDLKVVTQSEFKPRALHMLVQKDQAMLASIIDKAIIDIDQAEQEEIVSSWIKLYDPHLLTKEQLIELSLAITIIVAFLLYRHRTLSRYNRELERNRQTINEYLEVIDNHVLITRTDIDGVYTDVSADFCRLLNVPQAELLGTQSRLLGLQRANNMRTQVLDAIVQHGFWCGEYSKLDKAGDIIWFTTKVSPTVDADGNTTGYTLIHDNITYQKMIEKLTITDELTQLYNRRHFNEQIEVEMRRAHRENKELCFMMLDVDYFKKLNDHYGHQQGDVVLAKIGQTLNSLCGRASDFAFRLGGEEFGIIFDEQDPQRAEQFANRVRESIEALQIEHKYNEASDYVTVSVGLSVNPLTPESSADKVYAQADELLYEAKQSGRNRVATNL